MLVYIGAGLVALGLAVGVAALASGSSGPTGVAKSLSLIEGVVGDRSAVKAELGSRDRLLLPLMARMQGLAAALSPAGTGERLARMLDRAGNPSPWTPESILGTKGSALIVGVMLGLLYGGLSMTGVLLALVAGALLFFLPDLLLHNLALKRQEETSKGLAEALDMLSVCVQAGQGFDAALMQVARNVDGPISGEFARVLSEIQIGKSRGEAFAGMGERVALPEVKNFTSALTQADRLGLPIGTVLREQTATMRLVRRQKADEKAQKVTVKIMIPLLLCLFPALFIVIIGPGALSMMKAFSGM